MHPAPFPANLQFIAAVRQYEFDKLHATACRGLVCLNHLKENADEQPRTERPERRDVCVSTRHPLFHVGAAMLLAHCDNWTFGQCANLCRSMAGARYATEAWGHERRLRPSALPPLALQPYSAVNAKVLVLSCVRDLRLAQQLLRNQRTLRLLDVKEIDLSRCRPSQSFNDFVNALEVELSVAKMLDTMIPKIKLEALRFPALGPFGMSSRLHAWFCALGHRDVGENWTRRDSCVKSLSCPGLLENAIDCRLFLAWTADDKESSLEDLNISAARRHVLVPEHQFLLAVHMIHLQLPKLQRLVCCGYGKVLRLHAAQSKLRELVSTVRVHACGRRRCPGDCSRIECQVSATSLSN